MSDINLGIALQLAAQGWCVTPDFISPLLLNQLADDASADWQSGAFRHAGVGRGDQLQVRTEIRTDRVCWLDPVDCSNAQRDYLDHIEQLRLAINATLMLGLFDFEAHMAIYPSGSYYRKHLDRFQNSSCRTVSAVLYLNPHWTAADGGQLRLYTDPLQAEQHVDVLPLGGTLTCFLSDRFPHEVLPAGRQRLSLTGWYKTRDNGLP